MLAFPFSFFDLIAIYVSWFLGSTLSFYFFFYSFGLFPLCVLGPLYLDWNNVILTVCVCHVHLYMYSYWTVTEQLLDRTQAVLTLSSPRGLTWKQTYMYMHMYSRDCKLFAGSDSALSSYRNIFLHLVTLCPVVIFILLPESTRRVHVHVHVHVCRLCKRTSITTMSTCHRTCTCRSTWPFVVTSMIHFDGGPVEGNYRTRWQRNKRVCSPLPVVEW